MSAAIQSEREWHQRSDELMLVIVARRKVNASAASSVTQSQWPLTLCLTHYDPPTSGCQERSLPTSAEYACSRAVRANHPPTPAHHRLRQLKRGQSFILRPPSLTRPPSASFFHRLVSTPPVISIMGACSSSSAAAEEPNFSSIEPDTKPSNMHSSLADLLPAAANRYAVADNASSSPTSPTPAKLEETKENTPNPITTTTTTTTTPAPTAVTLAPATVLITDAQPRRLDPKDFIISKRSNETIVRRPGQIAGQSFMIEECNNCHIYLLDHSAAVNIDLCVNCTIVVGPCESSVFIRDCTDSSFIIACQQLRMRDSNNLRLLLSVAASQPTIESSDNLQLSAYRYSYPELSTQFKAAGLSPFNAHWDNVHDFHAKDGLHWSYAPFATDSATLGASPGWAMLGVGEPVEGRRGVAVETWGGRPVAGGGVERVLCVLREEEEDKAWQLLAHFQPLLQSQSLYVLRTRHVRLSDDKAAAVVGKDRYQPAVSGGKGGWIGLEWDGVNGRQLLSEWIGAQGWSSNAVVVVAAERTAASIESFFEAAAQV